MLPAFFLGTRAVELRLRRGKARHGHTRSRTRHVVQPDVVTELDRVTTIFVDTIIQYPDIVRAGTDIETVAIFAIMDTAITPDIISQENYVFLVERDHTAGSGNGLVDQTVAHCEITGVFALNTGNVHIFNNEKFAGQTKAFASRKNDFSIRKAAKKNRLRRRTGKGHRHSRVRPAA